MLISHHDTFFFLTPKSP